MGKCVDEGGGGESAWMRGCDMLESNRSELIKNKTTT